MGRSKKKDSLRRSRTSKWTIPIAVVAIVAVIAIAMRGDNWLATTQNPPSATTTPPPTTTTPPSTTTPHPSTIIATQVTGRIQDSKIIINESDLNRYGLLFVDAQLQRPASTVVYGDREIPLYDYRDGSAIPLLVYRTASGELRAAIRVCEPCHSWSMHIDGTNLVCDRCGTRWTTDTLTGVSGGCTRYPPISMPASASNNLISIDLSSLNLELSG
jgi:uncharacterized membrane protein